MPPGEKEQIGPYVIEAPLGRGSMGAVYLARDQRIGRRIALKQVQVASTQFEDTASAEEFYKRLQREAEVCGSLQHPNVVTLYDVGYEDGRISYLALEYVPGETLQEILKRSRPGPLEIDLAMRIGVDILRALDHAHGKGIVHRDVKPANVLIAQDGMAKLADFGIARPHGSSLTLAGSLMGTPNYMSPEQVKGTPTTARSDLFSVGVVLYEMVTGAKPFAAGDLSTILQNIVRLPTPAATAANPSVPAALDALIQRLTAKNPEDRPSSAAEALEALERLRAAPVAYTTLSAPPTAPVADVTEPVPGSRPESPSLLRRRLGAGVFLAVIGTALVVAAVPAVIIWSQIDDSPTVEIAREQLAEFDRKRVELASAKRLFENGRYAESLTAYERYLARYPHSTVARDGADRSRTAIAEQELLAKAKTSQKRAQPATATAEKAPEKKPPLVQRMKRGIKRLFRND